jgi:hypothetical protein
MQIVEHVQHLPMNDQKEKLELAMKNWKGNAKQRDGMLVVG